MVIYRFNLAEDIHGLKKAWIGYLSFTDFCFKKKKPIIEIIIKYHSIIGLFFLD